MMTFVFTFLFFLLVVASMAVGVIFSNKPIKGSCGGMGAIGLDTSCDICGGNPQVCEEQTRSDSAASELFYSADKNRD
ncbi:(Na+)-NQR maturation NqrM [Halieaceae bacterium IMCC14734]|uniref:(Na+)-NQR maturation NqrM n=1 Tax=Candidatus Litorirhabdus singularis TaxID=2518993 RepID=A0ABT3TJ26_9GAMM|nr:(Na+)-NQR maturation NqrM [Candidatus Litorirhabdus singularis]MCX2981419.1 (Na+)-NQR maturation NqrM [Candidatus Litorirhabdus singularis]